MSTYRVRDYQTGARLPGLPSADLVRQSDAAEPTGAVPAYQDDSGVWEYVQPSMVEQMQRQGATVRTVYVED